MSELRQNLLNGNWTLIAPERNGKPAALDYPVVASMDLPEYDPQCPFCPGNEEKFPLEILDETLDGQGNWITRTIDNKYKLFGNFKECPNKPEPYKKHGIFSFHEACGSHFLVIESRKHNKVMGLMDEAEIHNTLTSYQRVARQFRENPNNHITIIFKNQGPRAGASQPHSHSQIVGSRIVPPWIRNAMFAQDNYFNDNGVCPLCAMVSYELEANSRVILNTRHTVVLSPYAASAPYELWIIPKHHTACYENIHAEGIADITRSMKKILGAYISKLNNPDFNYFVHTAPHTMEKVPHYHTYIQILPRLDIPGGFETGTQIPVNTILPEDVPPLLLEHV